MIYGGTAHGFVSDPMFLHLNYRKKDWEKIIEEYFQKYHGLRSWHTHLIDTAVSTGFYESPSGRTYDYRSLFSKYEEWFYIPKIKNYPVQGFGADIVMVARISLYRRMREKGVKSLLINTIHDSILIDCPTEEVRGLTSTGQSCYNIVTLVNEVFRDLPSNLNRMFDINFDLPLTVEAKNLITGEKIVCT